MKSYSISATLHKAAGSSYSVGGVASSFHRDLDGEAITPDAVVEAIPGFMASRGADGIVGGPLRLHHDFWTRFLRNAITSLQLPLEQQQSLIAAISLPLGRVNQIWVDGDGVTHWKGELSQANPIAKIIWQMLQEGLVHLGVSLGGKILSTMPGRDKLGRLCTLINKIRLDEISITDNPALRLTEGEDTGAYISALSKSVRTVIMTSTKTQTFLKKALSMQSGGGAEMTLNAGTITLAPRKKNLGAEGDSIKPGVALPNSPDKKPQGGSSIPLADTTVTVFQAMAELKKAACDCDKDEASKPEMLKKYADVAYGLAGLTENPPPSLINMLKFLQELYQGCSAIPRMADSLGADAWGEMSRSLTKMVSYFEDRMPEELMQKTFRPAGASKIKPLDVIFPQQYVTDI